jgi:hypothetical protein
MILRRFVDAFWQQSWFTVVLEVLIVVTGIFIGLQVDDWNNFRFARESSRSVILQYNFCQWPKPAGDRETIQ